MSQEVVINGTTYPGVEVISMQDSEGNARMYFPKSASKGEHRSTA